MHWLDDKEEQALLDVMRNGSMFRSYGLKQPHHVDDFEQAARESYGVEHALAVNSGTGALICALSALGVGPGSEVIIPSFLLGGLCGLDCSGRGHPGAVRGRPLVQPRSRGTAPAHHQAHRGHCGHPYGQHPADMDRIMALANEHGVKVLEDCAQCNGGSYRGRKLGSIGHMAIFSLPS